MTQTCAPNQQVQTGLELRGECVLHPDCEYILTTTEYSCVHSYEILFFTFSSPFHNPIHAPFFFLSVREESLLESLDVGKVFISIEYHHRRCPLKLNVFGCKPQTGWMKPELISILLKG